MKTAIENYLRQVERDKKKAANNKANLRMMVNRYGVLETKKGFFQRLLDFIKGN